MPVEDFHSVGMQALWRAAKDHDATKAHFHTYAHRLIRHAMLAEAKYWRREKRRGFQVSLDQGHLTASGDTLQMQLPDPLPLADELIGERRKHSALREAIQKLKPSYRRLLQQRFFSELTLAAIALREGITREGVRRRELRALQALKGVLNSSSAKSRRPNQRNLVLLDGSCQAPSGSEVAPSGSSNTTARVDYLRLLGSSG